MKESKTFKAEEFAICSCGRQELKDTVEHFKETIFNVFRITRLKVFWSQLCCYFIAYCMLLS